MTLEESVAIFIYMLRTADSIEQTAERFQRSTETIYRCVPTHFFFTHSLSM
jgi:transposase